MKEKEWNQKDVNESANPDLTNPNEESDAVDFDLYPEIKHTSEDNPNNSALKSYKEKW